MIRKILPFLALLQCVSPYYARIKDDGDPSLFLHPHEGWLVCAQPVNLFFSGGFYSTSTLFHSFFIINSLPELYRGRESTTSAF